MKTKTFLKKFIMPNIIWIVPLVFCLLGMLGVEGLPDCLHAFYIGLILELVVLALWGLCLLLRYYKKRIFLLACGLLSMVAVEVQPMEQRKQSDACINYVESRQRSNEVQPMEQREQSDACINYVESRQRKNGVQPMSKTHVETGDAKGIIKGTDLTVCNAIPFAALPISNTYWRNEATGEWLIGFTERHVIFDNKVWDIINQKEKKDAYTITTDNGIAVKVGKMNKGQRIITIGDRKPIVCSLITTPALPDYPTKDLRKGFVDNDYKMGDSVTIIGWLKDMPEQAWALGREFGVGVNNIFTQKQDGFYAKMDSLGRFCLKMPLINSSQVFFDWKRLHLSSVMEPGKTYFLLCNFKTGQRLFMGDDVRVQNELMAYPHAFANDRIEEMEPGKADAMLFKARTDSLRSARMTELQERIAQHPNLSQRYIDYLTGYYLTGQGESMMQARFHMPGRELPQEYMDYVGELWQKRAKPYTLYRDFSTFMRDYIDQLDEKRPFSAGDRVVQSVRNLEQQGIITLAPEDSRLLEEYTPLSLEMDRKLSRAKSHEESQKMIEEFESIDIVANTIKLFDRIGEPLDKELASANIRYILATIDSIGCDRNLRDIYLACYLTRIIDATNCSLPPYTMEYAEQEIRLPMALNTVMALNDKYTALQNQDLAGAASLRPSSDVENMSEGEQILRKITEPYKGRIIYLDIWGTWCSPCKEQLSESHIIKEQLKDYDIVYLYLANNSPDKAWKNTIKEYNLTGDNCVHYNLPANQQSAIENYLNVYSFPTYKLIDKEGNIHDLHWEHTSNMKSFKETIAKLSK